MKSSDNTAHQAMQTFNILDKITWRDLIHNIKTPNTAAHIKIDYTFTSSQNLSTAVQMDIA